MGRRQSGRLLPTIKSFRQMSFRDYTGNVMKNRNGFVVEAELRQMSAMVERENREREMIVRC